MTHRPFDPRRFPADTPSSKARTQIERLYLRVAALEHGAVSVQQFGAIGDGETDDTAAVQKAVNAALASSDSSRPGLYLPSGEWALGKITIPDNLSIYGDGDGSRIRPLVENGDPVLSFTGSSDRVRLANFSIYGDTDAATFLSGASDAQNCTGIKFAADIKRWSIDNVHLFGLKVGADLTGFIGAADNFWIEYCETGLIGATLNSVDLNLRLENCRKFFAISGSNAVLFRQLLAEGATDTDLASTVDDCSGVLFLAPYFEWATFNRETPYLSIGPTTECQNVEIRGGSVAGPMAFGVPPIALDRVDGIDVDCFISTNDRNYPLSTTANTKNLKLNGQTGVAWFQDASKQLGPAFNYFPNRQFDLWLRGWSDVESVRATISKETTLVRRGANALKILADAGPGHNYCEIRLTGESVTALRGKTVRVGAWVFVPDQAGYDEALGVAAIGTTRYPPALYAASFNGSATVTSAARNTGFKKNSWQFALSSDLAVQADATRLSVLLYANNSALAATGAEFVVVDTVLLVEASVPFARLLNEELADSPLIESIGVGGRMIARGSAAPTDDDQVFLAGDQVLAATPAAEGTIGWVCTTGGSPGAWKTFGEIAA